METFKLKNANGIEITVSDYGGTITSIRVPDKQGKIEDIVLGFDKEDWYKDNQWYLGGIIGRYANRIAEGEFVLDGRTYNLSCNSEPNHLHGGHIGFNKVYWNVEEIELEGAAGALKLRYQSRHMEEGYPGNLDVEVLYVLTNDNVFRMLFQATSDRKTIVNLSNHTTFNLSGNVKRDVLNHELWINANYFLPVNNDFIPYGVGKVEKSVFDFRDFKSIGQDLDKEDRQLKMCSGYDHCYVLDPSTKEDKPAAIVRDLESGRELVVYTNKPGIQFYSGNYLPRIKNDRDHILYPRSGFCLEPQFFPDSPNQTQFPTPVLCPGEVYQYHMTYRFM